MYKVKHGLLPKCVTDLFSIKNSPYCLRNRNFSIPTYNTVQYGKHSLRYLGPHIWSKLDKADKERPTLQSVKTFIRRKNIADLIDNNCNSCTICSL